MHLEVSVSVGETITLPAQPSVGLISRIPLGGDGQNSPQAAYAVQGFTLTGATGGGNIGHTIIMDDRFCSLVSWVTVVNTQVASADADFRFSLASSAGNQVPLIAENGVSPAINAGVSPVTISELWRPPPVILPGGPDVGFVASRMLNVENDVVELSMMIFLFDINVRSETPMGPLLWARGAT